MSKFQKWLIIINIIILAVVLVKFIFFRKEEWTPPPLIDNTEKIMAELDSIKHIHANVDSLKIELNKKDFVIKSKNTSLIKLKENYEKEKFDISLLPADESLEFFTKFISTEK